MGAVAAKDPAGLPSAERDLPGLFILSEDLQAHLVVDLLALLDDDALGQLLSSEADRGSSDLLTVHQNTASVTRPVHVSVCEIPLSIDAENSESETLGITVRSIASSAFCISSLPVTTSPSALTTIHTPAKNANSSPYANPFASSGPRRDTYRSITRPISERRHHATSESIASPILCSHCMIRLYAVARLSTTTAIVVAHMGIEVKEHAS